MYLALWSWIWSVWLKGVSNMMRGMFSSLARFSYHFMTVWQMLLVHRRKSGMGMFSAWLCWISA